MRTETRAALNDAIMAVTRFGGSQRLAAVHAARSGVALTMTGVSVLRRLQRAGPVTMSDLAASCHLALPPLSRAAVVLQTQGFVERRPNPNDGRSTFVAITDAGCEAVCRFDAANAQLLDLALANWSDEEVLALSGSMLRLVGDLRTGGRS